MSEPLSPAQVAEIRARAEKATPGPWVGDRIDGTVKYSVNGADGAPVLTVQHKSGEFGFISDNAENDELFVLKSRTDVPALCDSYDAQAAQIELLSIEAAAARLHACTPDIDLKATVDAQARRIAQFKALVMEWENREAAVCPEDYSFEEVIKQQAAEIDRLKSDAATLSDEVARLKAKLNSPELLSFRDGVTLEAAHQRERWGSDHDAGKEPQDWFWLLGYLGGKALKAHADGDTDKALHHTISSAAVLANWHAAILGLTNMRPGIDPVERGIDAAMQPAEQAKEQG